ncbi:MAG: hypothetical protein HKN82_12360 [Akkermansiaceae bacterium]|nr:hypothetical protein [Akkermansiaceae bacterium]NNM29179.1 hypothetical protein [Akkermansiaceae bacterium]
MAAAVALLGGCGHVVTNENTYSGVGGVLINGAEVRSAVQPLGGTGGYSFSAMVYSAGSGTTDGPFLWRIEATGREGVHEKLRVHRLKVETRATQRSEWFPSKQLGKFARFHPLQNDPGKTFAQYQIPGKLEVYPEEDGAIAITADISVESVERTERRVVRFRMDPEQTRNVDFIFLPGEIVKGGSGPDPREWRW